MRLRSNERGLTMLEVIIASAIAIALAAVAMAFLSRFSGAQRGAESDSVAEQELQRLLASIELEWRYRAQPDSASYTAGAPSAFAGSACQDITIHQRDLATQTVSQHVSFTSDCAGGGDPNTNPGPPVPGVSCAPGRARVVVTRNGTVEATYPGPSGPTATAVCFRISGVGANVQIGVQVGSVVGHGPQAHVVTAQRMLTAQDRSPGVEMMR